MPSAKRRLAQIERKNVKVARNNLSVFNFFQRTDGSSAIPEKSEQTQPESTNQNPEQTQPESVTERPQLSTPTRKASGHKIGFQEEWRKNRPWLIVSSDKSDNGDVVDVMFCTLCQQHKSWGFNGSKVWVEKGCRTLRIDKVKEHESSAQHKKSLTTSLEVTLDNMVDNINTRAEQAIYDAMEVLYYIVVHNLPLNLFSSLVDLCVKVGTDQCGLNNLRCAKSAKYDSHDIVTELLTILSKNVRDEVKSEMKESESFSVMVDEVTDRATIKHVALCCKFIGESGDVKTAYLSDSEIKSATANNLVTSITREIEKVELNVQKMTGFASDGAAVFTGRKNGVAKQLRDINPSLLTTHCKDHRLALACRDAFADEPMFKKLDQTLDSIYTNYNFSTNKKANLQDVQRAFEEAPITIKEAKHHRWLSHEKAVSSIVRSYQCIVTELETSAISKDPQGNGILKEMKKPDILRSLLFLADALPHVTGISLYFQSRDCNLGNANAKVSMALTKLQQLKTVHGLWSKKAERIMTEINIPQTPPSHEFITARDRFLDRLTANIEERFTDTEVMGNLAILDLSKNDDIPPMYGNYEIETLGTHYGMDMDELLHDDPCTLEKIHVCP